MDTADLLAALRRLAQAQPGPKALRLPPGLSPHQAIRAVEAAVKALEAPTPEIAVPPATTSGPMRVHIDGGSRGNPGPAGIGVLFLRPDGSVAEQFHRGIGEATNNVAEYSALLAALERAATSGMTDVEVYSDSELLVRQIQGRYRVKHPVLRPLYAAARKRIAGFSHFVIHHVPRELNAAADALANRGIDEALPSGRRQPTLLDRGDDG